MKHENKIKEQCLAEPLDFIGETTTRKRSVVQQKRLNKVLWESAHLYRVLFENVNEGLVIIDIEKMEVLLCNEVAAKTCGFNSIEDAWGLCILDLVHPDDRERALRTIIEDMFGNDLHQLNEFRIITRDRQEKWISAIGTKVEFLGEILGLISFRDVTERNRQEAELRKTLEDLKRSNAELEKFAYIASHDLQEPLRMISSYMELLAEDYKGKLGADADEFIEYAMDGAKRMQGMIEALLEYSRVGTRGNPFEPTDCDNVLHQVMDNLQLAIEESGAVVTHDPLPTVMADGIQLVQLLQNLISNAIKFRNTALPRIHISAQKQGKGWIFLVKDNGIGIDPVYKDRIFVIFQRLHDREEYPGIGIGLSVCKRIVERHGGRIWVESTLGDGATFYFTIPEKRGEK